MREREIFDAALAIADSTQRSAYLGEACAGDSRLRQHIEGLLDMHRQLGSFLEPPGPSPVATVDEQRLRERPGTLIGPYKLLQQIGAGGMGIVYMAEQHEPVHRKVALKIIKPGLDSDQVIARFEAERQALALMDHPNIARVLDAGTTASGRPYFVMELVHGVPITQYCDDNQQTPRERLALAVPVCQAIQHAHQKGIIHRDVKPSNVLVAPYDGKPVVKVIDFGVAKAAGQRLTERTLFTEIGSVVGTLEYMSPEQAELNNQDIDTRSDIYGLGVLLYQLLTGTTPFTRERLKQVAFTEMLRLIREEEPPKPSTRLSESRDSLPSISAQRQIELAKLTRLVRGEIDWIVMKALEKDRTRRYETANGLARDLERYLADEPVEACPPSAGYRLRKFVRRNKGRVLATAALMVAVIAGTGAVLAVQRRANADLAAKNAELADEQATVQARNKELADEQAKVEARFELAQKAIALFHTGVSEDALLKNAEFKELRTKLLKEAAAFYADLEKLLAGQTDARSRKALAASYFQLAELTAKIGDKKEALAVHRKALAARRELAAAPGADVETRLEVASSLSKMGWLLQTMGNTAEARVAHEEQRDLAERLKTLAPIDAARVMPARAVLPEAAPAETLATADAVRVVLANAHHNIGIVLTSERKFPEDLGSYRTALAIYQKLADANPAFDQYQLCQAGTYQNIGLALSKSGKPAEALKEYQKSLDIQQKLADANPTVTDLQSDLAVFQLNRGGALLDTGKLEEALTAWRTALPIQQKLVDAHPAVTESQLVLAYSHNDIAAVLSRMGKPAEALKEFQQGLAIMQKLADANPTIPQFQNDLAWGHNQIGRLHAQEKRFTEAFAALDRALAIIQKLADAHPTIPEHTLVLGQAHAFRGWAHVRAGHPAEAAADLRRALELWEKGKAADNYTHFERSRALALLAGLAADGKSGVTRAEATTFADQAVASLRDAIKAGWNSPNEFQEPDFDALRGRDDVQKLLAELQAKSGPKAEPID
jgi:serine/threonine protein kinase/tetratricopeptide (TPR) repeat protein